MNWNGWQERAISGFFPPAGCEESSVRYSRISWAEKVSTAYHLVYPEGSSQDPRVLAFREWMLGEAGQSSG
jgi:DNA-binding transcriptional LysR family regulator